MRELGEFLQLFLILTISLGAALYAATFHPEVQLLLYTVWAAGFFADAGSTFLFYRKNPEGFRAKERNMILSMLIGKMGFAAGVLMFLLLIALPTNIVIGVMFIPSVQNALFGMQNQCACVAAVFAATGMAHFQAAASNIR
ncbi:MAG: hypothetical protein NWF09_08975 [Candidatus Bathyarchaeota archaeon]|nr:hypothetical protein [Candidatus Bathyarchaeota archaeon]